MKKVNWLSLIYLVSDFIIVFLISFLSFFGLLDSSVFNNAIKYILIYSLCLSLLNVVILAIAKEYKTLIPNFGITDALILGFVLILTNLISIVPLFIIEELNFSIHNIFIWAFVTTSIIFYLIFTRMIPRIIKILNHHFKTPNRVNTLIVGAGSAAKIVIDDSRNNSDSKNKIVVIVDDDQTKLHSMFSNIPVKGPINNVTEIIKKYNVEEVIIAIADLSEARLHEILGYLKESNVRIRRMPLLTEMYGPNDKRIVDVNINDLLNRNVIKLDNHEVKEILRNKVVMVTGAGGSIGSELTRQIFKAHPSTLILFDIYENSTYDIQQELNRRRMDENYSDIELVTLIGSTYNEKRVEQIIKKYKPDYIYHAAAYKHVPLMEDSPAEAIRTNVIGTYNVARMADKYGVKKMVLISTDKAVRPTNTMGATKRFAETIIQYFSEKSKNTVYAAVRFGNVLGSNGSVVPLFKKQIEEGGPITLTHKNIIRYFMTIPEAVALILQCGLYAAGGEIFILDMGKPFRIYDLAVNLIKQAGLVPGKDIKIIETGLRPGEKLFEELLLDTKIHKKTENDKIFIEEKESIKPIEEELKQISKVFDMDENIDIKRMLASIISTYKIDEH